LHTLGIEGKRTVMMEGSTTQGEADFEFAARFNVGQVVQHLKFDYRGVIVDVDATFALSDAWYDEVARSRPPKDRPWYHVLVSGSQQVSYVAERHLAADDSGEPVRHPLLEKYFERFEDGHYVPSQRI
jgi:heat shock protein HspQ